MEPGKFEKIPLSSLVVYLPHEELNEKQLRKLNVNNINSSNLHKAVSNFSKSRSEFRMHYISSVDFKESSRFVDVEIKFSSHKIKRYKITKKNLSHYL
ncbi:hypothetical protein HJ008_07370 [Vibrio parahaemolyticus]|nr:hypothetical protein [Vibrio parahaemolyticus]